MEQSNRTTPRYSTTIVYMHACHRRKDIDQIQDELMEEEAKGEETVIDVDDDLPGQGQFYCTPCARHFTDQTTKSVHIKSKLHKRRYPTVNGPCRAFTAVDQAQPLTVQARGYLERKNLDT